MKWDNFLFSPLTWLLSIGLMLALTWRRLPRAVRVTGLASEALFLIMMSPLGANALVNMIESRVPPITACRPPAPTTIVILSGGADRAPRSVDDYAALNVSSIRRLLAAIRLWRRTPGARLVISGGGWHIPEAAVLASLAEQMGVPATSISEEESSHTTWENARNVAALSPALPKRIWLVSSALHLPRALGAFRAWGFEPCAWPSDSLYEAPILRLGYFVPQSSSLEKANMAIHELIGSLVYRSLEWKRRRQLARSRPAASSPQRHVVPTTAASTRSSTSTRAVRELSANSRW
jgi:uncharacterized SAM-binding protein YcdF (DUF218 family)